MGPAVASTAVSWPPCQATWPDTEVLKSVSAKWLEQATTFHSHCLQHGIIMQALSYC